MNRNQYQPPQQQQQQMQQPQQQPLMAIKAKFKDWNRRTSIPANTTLEQFYGLLSSLFHLNINSSEHIVTYLDDEQDLIITTSEQEWADAKASFSTPNMTVVLKEKVPVKTAQALLKHIKDQPKVQPPQQTQPQPQQQQTPTQPQQPQTQPQPQVMPFNAQQPPQQQQQTQPQPQQQQPSGKPLQESWDFFAISASQAPTSYSAKFVCDVNLPDGSSVYLGEQVTKTWKINNTGTTPWPADVQFRSKELNNQPFDIVSSKVPQAKAGEDVEVSVTIIPRRLGTIKGFFKLSSGDIQFGHLCWFELAVHPLPVQEAPQVQYQQQPQQPQQQTQNCQLSEQIRDLKIADIKDCDDSDDESDDELETFEDGKFQALCQKYAFQLEVLKNMEIGNAKVLVEILEENGGDINKTIQEYVLRSSRM